MLDLITVGEILIDLTQTGEDAAGIRQYAANPGGAPANTAVAAARMGASSALIGKVGQDSFGADLRRVLENDRVDVSGLCTTAEAPTTLAVVSVDPSGERDFVFYRSPGADTLLTAEEAVRGVRRLGGVPKILHAGSVSLTGEPSREATLTLIRRAKAAGALISYDPNYRARLWPGEEAAVEQMQAVLDWCDIVKLSEEELPLLTGTDDLEKGTQVLADRGAALAVVTLGGRGTYYRLGGDTGRVPAVPVKVADTNGAGDTFAGALLSRLALRGDRPLAGLTRGEAEEILAFSNCAAALTCSRSGAIPAIPHLEEVLRFQAGNKEMRRV